MDDMGFIKKEQQTEIDNRIKNENNIHAHDFENKYHNNYAKHIMAEKKLHDAKKRDNGQDSNLMSGVKEHLAEITRRLQEEMADNYEDFVMQIIDLNKEYKKLIDSCQLYLKNRKLAKFALFGKRKARRKMVLAVLELAKKEKSTLKDLGKNKELFDMRVKGALVGNALSNAVRDNAAVDTHITIDNEWTKEGEFLTKRFDHIVENKEMDHTVYTVSEKAGKKANEIKSAVSAGRILKFFGAEELGNKPEYSIVKNERQQAFYGIKEQFKGNELSLSEIYQKEQDCDITYSGEAMRCLSNIRMLTILFGAKDFDEKRDIKFTFERKDLGTGVCYLIKSARMTDLKKMFSNDVNKKTLERLSPDGKELAMLDIAMVGAIANIDEKEVELLTGDMLSKDQRKSFISRLSYIKNIIRIRTENNNIVGIKDWNKKATLESVNAAVKLSGNEPFKNLFNDRTAIHGQEGDKIREYEERKKTEEIKRLENERKERERLEREEKERLEKEERERKDRLEKEKKEKEEIERIEREIKEREEREALERKEREEREALERKEREEREARERKDREEREARERKEKEEWERKQKEKEERGDEVEEYLSPLELERKDDKENSDEEKYSREIEEKLSQEEAAMHLGKRLYLSRKRNQRRWFRMCKVSKNSWDTFSQYAGTNAPTYAADAFEEAYNNYMKPIRSLIVKNTEDFLAKNDRTKEEWENYYKKITELKNYIELIDSYAFMDKNHSSDYAWYFNSDKFKKTPKGKKIWDEIEKRNKEIEDSEKKAGKAYSEFLRENRKLTADEEGKKRTKLDDELEKEEETYKNRSEEAEKLDTKINEEENAFGKLSELTQYEKRVEEAEKLRKQFENEILPEYLKGFETIEKYMIYLEKNHKESDFYQKRIEAIEKKLGYLDKLIYGENAESRMLRKNAKFKNQRKIKIITCRYESLKDKFKEDKRYLEYYKQDKTGVLKKTEEKLDDYGKALFATFEADENKKNAINEFIEEINKIKSNEDSNKDKILNSIIELSDKYIQNGIMLEHMTKEQFDMLEKASPFAARKVYTEYLSRNRFKLDKEVNLASEKSDIISGSSKQYDWIFGNEYEKDIEIERLSSSIMQNYGYEDDETTAYIIKSKIGGKKYITFQNPLNLKIFNSIKQGGGEKNYKAYSGTCGPSSCAHTINQLYGMNISSENQNVYLVTSFINDNKEFLPDRDPFGNVIKPDGERLDRFWSGGTEAKEIGQLLDMYNIKHEIVKRGKYTANSDEHRDKKTGLDLDIIRIADELDKGNVIQMSINAEVLWEKGRDPRKTDGFYEGHMVRDRKEEWKRGKGYSTHWICVCGVCYEFSSNQGLEKEDRKISGFMIKDTGNGKAHFVDASVLEMAYRGIKAKMPEDQLTIYDSEFIVCHKPKYDDALNEEIENKRVENEEKFYRDKEEEIKKKEEEEERKKKEEEERKKKEEEEQKRKKEEQEAEKKRRINEEASKIKSIFNDFKNKLVDIKTVEAFYNEWLKDYDNKEKLAERDKQRKEYFDAYQSVSNERKRINKDTNEDVMDVLKEDKEYKALNKELRKAYDDFTKLDEKLIKPLADTFDEKTEDLYKKQGYDEFVKKYNKDAAKEMADQWENDIINGTGKYDHQAWVEKFQNSIYEIEDLMNSISEEIQKEKLFINTSAYKQNTVYSKKYSEIEAIKKAYKDAYAEMRKLVLSKDVKSNKRFAGIKKKHKAILKNVQDAYKKQKKEGVKEGDKA